MTMDAERLDTTPAYTSDVEHWERQAGNWAAWTRGDEADAYPDYSPRFFQLLPPPDGPTLEVGCGEGRVSRDLRAAGYDPTGIDAVPALVELARQADPGGRYLVAQATALPFNDAAFRLVVAYNSLMDIDDMPAAVREIARVLVPRGRLCACVTHPVSDAGRFEGDDADAPFVIRGSYLGSRPFLGMAERNGVTMEFRGWAHPFEAYFRAFEAAGLAVEVVREPAAAESTVARSPGEGRWSRMPMFLFLRAIKL